MSSLGAALMALPLVLAGPPGRAGTPREPTAPRPIDFDRDIRPILSEACFPCHGPDVQKHKADLRLDVKDDTLRDRDGHAAVVPGEPERSELFARIASDDDSERMPPPGSGR